MAQFIVTLTVSHGATDQKYVISTHSSLQRAEQTCALINTKITNIRARRMNEWVEWHGNDPDALDDLTMSAQVERALGLAHSTVIMIDAIENALFDVAPEREL